VPPPGRVAVPGRHRPTGTLRRRQARLPLVIAGVAVLATSTILVMQNLADAGGCSSADGVRLEIAADPAIAPVLRQVAADWTSMQEPEVNGRCVAIEVSQAPTADVAGALAAASGSFLDVAAGASPPSPESLPAVWVPDSSYWITRMRSISRSLFEEDRPSLASSPIMLAVTPAGAGVLGEGPVPVAALREPLLAAVAAAQQGQPPPLPLALSEPRRDTAGLVAAAWIQSAVVTSDGDLPFIVALFRAQRGAPQDTAALLPAFDAGVAAAPMSEQAIIHYNSTTPPTAVTAVRVVDAPALDFPYAVLERQPRDLRTAAGMFRDALVGAADVLAQHGFRAPDGTAGAGFPTGNGVTGEPAPALAVGPPERFDQARRIWTSATSDARVLSVVNINSSMRQTMPTEQGPVPRIEIFRATARQGVALFTDGTDLGHWEYAARLDGEQDWREGVPIALLTEEHTARIMQAIDRAQPVDTNEAAMFETLLAAYQEMKDGWDPVRSNTLVMWTDSGDTKQDGLTLEEALRELERIRDLTRPIRVVLQGLGPDVNMAHLEALAQATGGVAFQITDPDQIQMVFLRALLALPPVTPR
jgi:hypothetical protein